MNADRPPPRFARIRRPLLVVLLTSLALSFLTALIAVVGSGLQDDRLAERLLYTPMFGIIYAAIGLEAIHFGQRDRFAQLMAGALIALTLGSAAFVAVMFAPRPWRGHLARIAGTLIVPALAAIFSARLLLLPAPLLVLRVAVRAELLAIGVLAATSIMLMWTRWRGRYEDLVWAVVALGTALVFTGLLALPIFAGLARKRGAKRHESIPTRLTLALSCPRCGAEQTLATGLTACAACRAALIIEIEEPRCACGYLLYRLQGKSCPECGRPIPAGQRWPRCR